MVQTAFLRAMASLHPDTLAGESDGFDEHATARAAEVNLAREQLLDEASRAESLLLLRGGASVTQDKSVPDGFFAKMMEAREELDAAQEAGDQQGVQRSVAWAKSQREQTLARVRVALEQGNLTEARKQLNACRSIDRMLEHVRRDEQSAKSE
jgi:DnaJ-domain-containing protein 1